MSIDFDTHQAPRPQRKPKPELPPLVRDYLEFVRGNPEISGQLPFDYLDRLWGQATEFAERNGVDCPVHREEVEALRIVVEARMAALWATPLAAEGQVKAATSRPSFVLRPLLQRVSRLRRANAQPPAKPESRAFPIALNPEETFEDRMHAKGRPVRKRLAPLGERFVRGDRTAPKRVVVGASLKAEQLILLRNDRPAPKTRAILVAVLGDQRARRSFRSVSARQMQRRADRTEKPMFADLGVVPSGDANGREDTEVLGNGPDG